MILAQDLSRIKTDVGYDPEHTIETGVAAYIEWLVEQGGHADAER